MSLNEQEAEAAVTRIWTEIGLRPTGPDDDFFDLGGQSLNLVQFLARVHDRYGVELPVDLLFEADLTVASAAGHLREAVLAGQRP
ncbi:acyl carrier protein [Luedemannella helvata]|uniref:Carrier domain-containing protein n=1 Tax=Luedemannella helvata TaxID=349315 RepID=A0ABN2JSL4_9ACTN